MFPLGFFDETHDDYLDFKKIEIPNKEIYIDDVCQADEKRGEETITLTIGNTSNTEKNTENTFYFYVNDDNVETLKNRTTAIIRQIIEKIKNTKKDIFLNIMILRQTKSKCYFIKELGEYISVGEGGSKMKNKRKSNKRKTNKRKFSKKKTLRRNKKTKKAHKHKKRTY